jgi:hypothetical protein
MVPYVGPGTESTAMKAASVWRFCGANVVVSENFGALVPGIRSVR